MSIRRELTSALRKVDATRQAAGHTDLFADAIKIQIIQTGIFASALRVVEFYKPEKEAEDAAAGPQTQAWAKDDPRFTHGLSRHAYEVANTKGLKLELDPLLSGPLAVVSFPAVAPEYLKAVLSILSPSPAFPAPRRREKPSYHDPSVQLGLQKLLLLAARVEGKVFDVEGTKWVGGIEGGLDGLRAQLVHVLQSVGAGVTSALEGASRSLYFTVESRRLDMEEKEKPAEEEKKE
jgi:ribosomal protein L10